MSWIRSLLSILKRATPRTTFTSGLILGLVLVIIHAGSYLFIHDSVTLTFISDILVPISDAAATLAMVYGVFWGRNLGSNLTIVWSLFAGAMACLTVGDALWAYYELGLGEVPIPFVGDIFYLLSYPLFFAGILIIPREREGTHREAWLWLDSFIILFSAFGIYWNFLIGPSLLAHDQPLIAILVDSVYPAGDLLLIMAIMLVMFRPRSPLWRRPLILMLIGQVTIMLADSIYNYQSLNDLYAPDAFIYILYTVGPVFIMFGGLSQAVIAQKVIEKRDTIPIQSGTGFLDLMRWITPFFWLLLAYGTLTFGSGSKQVLQPAQLSLWIAVIIILLIVRQVLATLDNERLSRQLHAVNNELEKRIEQRSADLLLSNIELRKEMEERKRIEMMLREREERFAHFALHDPLTDLPNRSLLLDRISHALQHYRRTGEHFAILFLDLDGFKVINDSLGHVTGDDLLVQISKRLLTLFRAEDTVARLGGDEFVILLERVSDESFILAAAERVLKSSNEPFTLADRTIHITASAGIVIVNSEYSTPVEIIRDADVAMYKAKATGKNNFVVFNPELRRAALHRLAIDSDLRRALSNNEFVLYYEPILLLETFDLVGLEALIRWNHPVYGLISPSEFIPIAESIGLIDSITQWTIQEACRQLGEWKSRFPQWRQLWVSINISPRTLRRSEFSQWVNKALEVNALPVGSIVLEITESTLVQEAELAKGVFNYLRSQGVKVCLDDFGTGYSSLGYISEYPVDILKIDRSFVNRAADTDKVVSLMKGIVSLARALDLEVIVEGIETTAQVDLVRQIDGQYGQGFLFSRAADVQSIEAKYLR